RGDNVLLSVIGGFAYIDFKRRDRIALTRRDQKHCYTDYQNSRCSGQHIPTGKYRLTDGKGLPVERLGEKRVFCCCCQWSGGGISHMPDHETGKSRSHEHGKMQLQPGSTTLIGYFAGQQAAHYESQAPGNQAGNGSHEEDENIRGQFSTWHATQVAQTPAYRTSIGQDVAQ